MSLKRRADILVVLAELHLEGREEVTSLNNCFLLGRHYISVGTAIFPSDEDFEEFTYAGGSAVASKEGRLLLIEPVHNDAADRLDIKIVTQLRTSGPVHDTKVIHGFLAVAFGSSVGCSFPTKNIADSSRSRYIGWS